MPKFLVMCVVIALALFLSAWAPSAAAAPCSGPTSYCHCHTDDGIVLKCRVTVGNGKVCKVTWPASGGRTGSSTAGASGTTASVLVTTGPVASGTTATATTSGPNCDTSATSWDESNSPHCSKCP